MFEKTKRFVKDHKYEIIAGATIAAAGIAVGMAIGKNANKDLVELGLCYQGKNSISWVPNANAGFMDLERVKTVLDANADNTSCFVIFREGLKSEDYTLIMMSDDVVIPEVV